MIASAGPSPLWYLARGSGAVMLVLLTATLVLGMTGALRWRPGSRTPRFVVEGLHRNLALVAVTFLVLHVATAVLDPFAHLHLLSAVVPFTSSYRPLWLGLGAVAFDLLAALVITSLVRRRLGLRAWRAVHWAAYACWPVAVLHGLGTGTDARSPWFEVLTATCVLAVLATVSTRITGAWPNRRAVRIGVLGVTVATFCAGTIFALAGPLAPGWARRAGTPAKLLASVHPGTATASARTVRASRLVPIAGSLQGTIQRSATGEGTARVDIAATLQGVGRTARVGVLIAGRPLTDGGLEMTSSAVSLGTPARPDLYSGRIVTLDGTRLVARLHRPGARPVSLQLALQLAEGSSLVTGAGAAREAG